MQNGLFDPVTLIFDLLTTKAQYFKYIPSLNTLGSLVSELFSGQTDIQTDRQTNKQTDSEILPTPTNIVGVGNHGDIGLSILLKSPTPKIHLIFSMRRVIPTYTFLRQLLPTVTPTVAVFCIQFCWSVARKLYNNSCIFYLLMNMAAVSTIQMQCLIIVNKQDKLSLHAWSGCLHFDLVFEYHKQSSPKHSQFPIALKASSCVLACKCRSRLDGTDGSQTASILSSLKLLSSHPATRSQLCKAASITYIIRTYRLRPEFLLTPRERCIDKRNTLSPTVTNNV